MATSIRDFERSFKCGSVTLALKQYYIVKQDTDGTVILSAAGTDKHVGVLQNKPAIGVSSLVRFMGTSKVISGGVIAVGAFVTSDASGKAVSTSSASDYVLGKYIGTAAAASGDIIEVQLGMFVI